MPRSFSDTLLRNPRDLNLRISLTMTAKRLVVALATLELTNHDLVVFSVHHNRCLDLCAGDVRLSDDCRLSVIGQKQDFVEHDFGSFLALKAWNVHFHAFFHLLLKACDVDECKHELGECSGTEKALQQYFAAQNTSVSAIVRALSSVDVETSKEEDVWKPTA